MGKRTNTILQSAFFSLAKVMPAEDAIKYMKDAAEHSYLKKGRDVVEKNWNAIDVALPLTTRSMFPLPGLPPRTTSLRPFWKAVPTPSRLSRPS